MLSKVAIVFVPPRIAGAAPVTVGRTPGGEPSNKLSPYEGVTANAPAVTPASPGGLGDAKPPIFYGGGDDGGYPTGVGTYDAVGPDNDGTSINAMDRGFNGVPAEPGGETTAVDVPNTGRLKRTTSNRHGIQ